MAVSLVPSGPAYYAPLFRRLLDPNDIQWIREQAGAAVARRVRRNHAIAYFGLLSRLKREGSAVLQSILAAQSADLEQIVRFDVLFRWHMFRLTAAGLGFLVGVDTRGTVAAVGRALDILLAPPQPAAAIATL